MEMIDWDTLIGVVVGGLISFAGMAISEKSRIKTQREDWIRDKRTDLYIELIDCLESIKIPILLDENYHGGDLTIDTDEINSKIEEIDSFIDQNRGKIYVFASNDIYTEIMKLKSELYECTKIKTVDFKDLVNSEMFKTMKHAFTISYRLKQELLS